MISTCDNNTLIDQLSTAIVVLDENDRTFIAAALYGESFESRPA